MMLNRKVEQIRIQCTDRRRLSSNTSHDRNTAIAPTSHTAFGHGSTGTFNDSIIKPNGSKKVSVKMYTAISKTLDGLTK